MFVKITNSSYKYIVKISSYKCIESRYSQRYDFSLPIKGLGNSGIVFLWLDTLEYVLMNFERLNHGVGIAFIIKLLNI